MTRPLSCLIILFLLQSSLPVLISGQTILVQPYLQNATPQSMVIMWETNSNTATTVQYGTTLSLGNITNGTAINTLGSTILHTATLTNLTPGTKYFYKCITGSWQSTIADFVTPPLRTSEANLNIVLMSDMQKDGSNPNIFSNLINTSLLPYIANQYGTPLSEHLQMALLPGDVVDVGNAYLQYKNDFFNPGEALWRSVPSYPAIGNHEANSQNYFNYFNLPANGTSGYLEHWYMHDYSNVRVLSFDSNNPYRIQAQLNWLDSILNVSCADTLIDFVFAQMHHPFKSELWTPGETDYTGQIVQRLEDFSDNCGKPTIHFFGHTHAYSRGQSQDHKHLWVNVATSGGNIDYWGEFDNEDYEEFVISQDEYGFVMVEVTAGNDPQFTLRRLSFGDQNNPGGSTLTDLITVRKNNSAPTTPFPLFPLGTDTVSSFCVTLKADGFYDPESEGHGSSQWQISADSVDFSNPIFDSWKQHANWYNEVDLQADDDLTDEEVSGLPDGTTLWWRVRYRDKGLQWSPWSSKTRFYTDDVNSLTGNIVLNPGAESGISNWTASVGVIESLNPGECAGINPYAGQKYFAVGALCVEHPFASAFQNLSVASFASIIDAGNVQAYYGAYLADWNNTDEPSFALQFLNGSGQVISGTDTTRHQMSAWTLKEKWATVPAGTRTIRFILMGTRFAGADNDSYVDNVFLQLMGSENSCSVYEPPGPIHDRIYVDQNAPAFSDGKSWVTAFKTLNEALSINNNNPAVNEIWIADGSYKVTTTSQRGETYYIQHGVDIFGGFSGGETSINQRNIIANPTILSGEIGDLMSPLDNSYHVVSIAGSSDTVLLDGLTITGGYADALGIDRGGGLYISPSNLSPSIVNNCSILDNHALVGSSIYNTGHLSVKNSLISNQTELAQNGSILLNSGSGALLKIDLTTIIQPCNNCLHAIKNEMGASLHLSNTVNLMTN